MLLQPRGISGRQLWLRRWLAVINSQIVGCFIVASLQCSAEVKWRIWIGFQQWNRDNGQSVSQFNRPDFHLRPSVSPAEKNKVWYIRQRGFKRRPLPTTQQINFQ